MTTERSYGAKRRSISHREMPNSKYQYGVTIYPTKTPNEVPYWEVLRTLQEFVSFNRLRLHDYRFEFKNTTDVVHIHAYVSKDVPVYFIDAVVPFKGFYVHHCKILSAKEERRWLKYITKEDFLNIDKRRQQMWDHAARNLYLFD